MKLMFIQVENYRCPLLNMPTETMARIWSFSRQLIGETAHACNGHIWIVTAEEMCKRDYIVRLFALKRMRSNLTMRIERNTNFELHTDFMMLYKLTFGVQKWAAYQIMLDNDFEY
jgi:hypothetical protein